MKNIIFIFAIVLTFCFTATAQFSFTSQAGKKFSVSSAPQKTDPRGGGFVMEFYYTVEGSDLVVYEVGKSDGEISNTIQVTKVPIDQIKANSFKVQKSGSGCYLQTGTPYTKFTHGSNFNPDDKYSSNNLQLDFKNCDDANAFRTKVLGDEADELDLGDLDLDLEDKPKAKSTMPAHLFALVGGAASKTYQFNRKNMEVWDYTRDDIFKVGKISQLKMLVADESYFTYNVRSGKLYNGDKFLGIELDGDEICKSFNGEKCFSKYEIDREEGILYSVFEDGKKRYKLYTISGEATNEEILLIFAFIEKF
jgi:hypothetical protein